MNFFFQEGGNAGINGTMSWACPRCCPAFSWVLALTGNVSSGDANNIFTGIRTIPWDTHRGEVGIGTVAMREGEKRLY